MYVCVYYQWFAHTTCCETHAALMGVQIVVKSSTAERYTHSRSHVHVANGYITAGMTVKCHSRSPTSGRSSGRKPRGPPPLKLKKMIMR